MNTILISVTSPSFCSNQQLVNELREFFPNAKLNIEGRRFSKEALKEFLSNSDGAIIGLETIDEEVLKACPTIRAISKYGVGLDNIDLEACSQANVKIGWTGGVNRLSVAEMTLGFMLALSLNMFRSCHFLKKLSWQKKGGFQLSEKTIGIIGVGNIGKEVVRLLQPFNCRILVNDIIDQGDYYQKNGLIEATKEEIYSEADIITIHTPLTARTKYLINSETLSKMKQSAFVINTARGEIVKQDDLREYLKTCRISGAALDVYEVEPPVDKELLSLPNLVCTPHIGGNAEEAVLAMGRSAINHLREFFIK